MDLLFLDLVGKPTLNPAKIITIIAENFSFLDDQAKFLRATLAIPVIKQLPLDNISKRLVQIGPLHSEVADFVKRSKWGLSHHETFNTSVCDKLEHELSAITNRSLIFLNDVSRLSLHGDDGHEFKRMTSLAIRLKLLRGHFMVMLCQQSYPPHSKLSFLRNLEHVSDAVIRAQTCRVGYYLSIWWYGMPESKTLIPSKIETAYYTCKIGKFYYAPELLCFHGRKKVTKEYDLNYEAPKEQKEREHEQHEITDEEFEAMMSENSLERLAIGEKDPTLPYYDAQSGDKSQIFYYPDETDDLDEDDPDDDVDV